MFPISRRLFYETVWCTYILTIIGENLLRSNIPLLRKIKDLKFLFCDVSHLYTCTRNIDSSVEVASSNDVVNCTGPTLLISNTSDLTCHYHRPIQHYHSCRAISINPFCQLWLPDAPTFRWLATVPTLDRVGSRNQG